jgi:prefoldin subunit 5
MPMFLLMNVSDIPGFAIPILNTVVDMMKGLSAMTMNLGKKSVREMIKLAIKKEDDNINNINEEIKQLNQEITNLKNGIGTDKDTLRALRKKNGEDTTSKGKKNKDKNRKERK